MQQSRYLVLNINIFFDFTAINMRPHSLTLSALLSALALSGAVPHPNPQTSAADVLSAANDARQYGQNGNAAQDPDLVRNHTVLPNIASSQSQLFDSAIWLGDFNASIHQRNPIVNYLFSFHRSPISLALATPTAATPPPRTRSPPPTPTATTPTSTPSLTTTTSRPR